MPSARCQLPPPAATGACRSARSRIELIAPRFRIGNLQLDSQRRLVSRCPVEPCSQTCSGLRLPKQSLRHGRQGCCELPERRVLGCHTDLPNGPKWVGSRPAAFAETPPNSRQAVSNQNANLPPPEDRQVIAPCPSRQNLADRHDLDLDCIRDLFPVLVTGPSRQPIPSG